MKQESRQSRAEAAWRENPIAAIRLESERICQARGRRRQAFVLTFGCQQNEADSEKLAGLAEAMGYEITSEPREADLIVVNTCAIREHAEKKALSIVGQFKHLKAKRPDMMIAVCGCMVTQEHRREEIKRRRVAAYSSDTAEHLQSRIAIA